MTIKIYKDSAFNRVLRVPLFTFLVTLLGACGTIPNSENYVAINPPALKKWKVEQTELPSRPPNVICSTNDLDCLYPVFIGVAISGGGSRAANFGLGALAQLTNLGISNRVSAYSSVSGGSLTAAAYVLNPFKSEEEFQDLATKLRTDFLESWLISSLNPRRIISTTLTADNATHTLADVFYEKIFDNKKFSDLNNPGGPKLYINASLINEVDITRDLTTRGDNSPSNNLQGFTFTSNAFEAMGSDLSAMRVADAVAASGAYPGLFETIALRDYLPTPHQGEIDRPAFLHLTDGGVSDNLGTDALVRAYSQQIRYDLNTTCLLIIIDAHVSDQGDLSGYYPDLRTSLTNRFISRSLSRSFDLLLDRRREDQLNSFNIQLAKANPTRFIENIQIPLGNEQFSSNGYSSIKEKSRNNQLEWRVNGGQTYTHATCAIWHIPLDGLLDLSASKGKTYRQIHTPYINGPASSTRDKDLNKLDRFVNSIETNYKLSMSGSGKCPVRTIQNGLFEAAYQLIATDRESLKSLENWFIKNKRTDIAEKIKAKTDSDLRLDVHVPAYEIRTKNLLNPLTASIDCDDS